MRTPVVQGIVLLGTVVVLGMGFALAQRWSRGLTRSVDLFAGEPLRPTPHDSAIAGEASVLAAPEPITRALRGRVDRPLDEARCGASPDEATLTATIEDAEGRRITEAWLGLFELVGDRPDCRRFLSIRVQDDGRACLRTTWAGDVLVTAFAPGFRPCTRRIASQVGARIDLEPFVLEQGASIAGRVRVGGEPLGRAEVEIVTCPECEAFEIGNVAYAWRRDRFVAVRLKVETSADGAYRAGGLDRGDHVVRLFTVRRREFAVDVSKCAPEHALAPAEGVDFDLPAARLELQFKSGPEPLCCAEVQIEAGDRQYTRTADESGRLVVMVQPALAYPLTIARRGFLTKRVQLRGLVDGERHAQTIALEVQEVMATVIVRDDSKERGDTAVVSFLPRMPLMHGSAFERTLKRDGASGAFLVTNVPSGAWRVILGSGRVLSGTSTARPDELATTRQFCPADALVDVPDSGTVSVSVFPRPTPAAAVVARDAHGERVPARVKLFDSSGEEIEGVVSSEVERDARATASPELGEVPMLVHATHCPGPFDVAVFAEGFETVRVRIAPQGALPQPVNVVLVPR